MQVYSKSEGEIEETYFLSRKPIMENPGTFLKEELLSVQSFSVPNFIWTATASQSWFSQDGKDFHSTKIRMDFGELAKMKT